MAARAERRAMRLLAGAGPMAIPDAVTLAGGGVANCNRFRSNVPRMTLLARPLGGWTRLSIAVTVLWLFVVGGGSWLLSDGPWRPYYVVAELGGHLDQALVQRISDTGRAVLGYDPNTERRGIMSQDIDRDPSSPTFGLRKASTPPQQPATSFADDLKRVRKLSAFEADLAKQYGGVPVTNPQQLADLAKQLGGTKVPAIGADVSSLMPIRVNVLGHGIVEFPAGTSEETMREALAVLQRMIDAGETEQNIATVIRHFETTTAGPAFEFLGRFVFLDRTHFTTEASIADLRAQLDRAYATERSIRLWSRVRGIVALALLPPIVLFVFGLTVGWIFRGFRPKGSVASGG